ncbi:MAG TPA: MerR family transcriptional regulator [Actinomycetota bacterium]|nr:MerR family transcriptional regulator [Actinomycetota bacterium]
MTVGQVARLAGVTIRTLHHYDEIGLLSPSVRSPAGYRRYGGQDIERLQRILFYRELGFALSDVGRILDDNLADAGSHLRRQHRLLRRRIAHLQDLVAAVEKEMEAYNMGIQLTPEERLEIFGDRVPEEYADEAEERWGETEAYQQSMRRVSTHTKADWLAIKAESSANEGRIVEAFRAGAEPASGRAMDLAEEHRQHISRWFYDCPPAMHRGLGDMYVNDPRFTANYEKLAPGLAEWLRTAIAANADRQSV